MTTTIATDVAPTPVQLWALAYLLRANWRDAVTTRSSFETNITAARSTAEQRFGLRAIPFRTSSVLLSASGQAEVHKLRLFMQRAGQSRFLFPVYSDVTQATTALTITQTVISCDTTCRRFSVGRRVVVCANSNDTTPTFETGIISAISSTTITLSVGLANAYAAHATIMPLMEANLVLNSSGGVVTSQYAHATFTAVESASGLQLANALAVGATPDGYPTYNDVPIFDTEPNYAEDITFNVIRSGSAMDSGIDSLPAVFGSRAAYGFRANYPTYDRASLWKLLQFFESRGGMLLSFFGISPTVEFTATAVGSGGSSVTVQANTLEYDWAYTGYIAVRQVDGTVDVRKVTTVVRIGNSDTVTFDSAIIGLTLDNIQRVHHAFYARFDQDELAESWANNVVQNTSLSIKELIEEKDVTVADLVKIVTSDLVTVWRPDKCSELGLYRQARRCVTGHALVNVWMTAEVAFFGVGTKAFVLKTGPNAGDCLFFDFADDPSTVPGSTYDLLDIDSYTNCAACQLIHGGGDDGGDDDAPCVCDNAAQIADTVALAVNATVEYFSGNNTCSGAADYSVTGTTNYTMEKDEINPCKYWLGFQTTAERTGNDHALDFVAGDEEVNLVQPGPPCYWSLNLTTAFSPANQNYELRKSTGNTPIGSYTPVSSTVCLDNGDGTSIRLTVNSAVIS